MSIHNRGNQLIVAAFRRVEGLRQLLAQQGLQGPAGAVFFCRLAIQQGADLGSYVLEVTLLGNKVIKVMVAGRVQQAQARKVAEPTELLRGGCQQQQAISNRCN